MTKPNVPIMPIPPWRPCDHSELFSAGLPGQLQDTDVLIYVRGRHGDAQIFHPIIEIQLPLEIQLVLEIELCLKRALLLGLISSSLIPQEERIEY